MSEIDYKLCKVEEQLGPSDYETPIKCGSIHSTAWYIRSTRAYWSFVDTTADSAILLAKGRDTRNPALRLARAVFLTPLAGLALAILIFIVGPVYQIVLMLLAFLVARFRWAASGTPQTRSMRALISLPDSAPPQSAPSSPQGT